MDIQNYIETFAKDCAKNYRKGVEFSIELSFGEFKGVYHFPQGIKELEHLSLSRLRKAFEDCVWQFMGVATIKMDKDEKSELHIKILPLISRDYMNCMITNF
jgi:hypothetical protein